MTRASKKSTILKVAQQLFAEKGYNATGMDEIASKSEIPKSLIYYHFKNKEGLLNTIITNFIDEYNKLLHDQTHGIEKISVYIAFLKQNKECARIVISESLKTGNNQNLPFKLLSPLMEIDAEQACNKKMDHAHWISELFTSILPSILFACYEEDLCSHFDVSAEQMEKDFFTAYKLTHGAYHNHIDKESL